MPIAERHTFKSKDPVELFIEQNRFYVKLRGSVYHPVMPMPKTTVSDCRQAADYWSKALGSALRTLMFGLATEWKPIVEKWADAAKRLRASTLGPNDVYDDNPGFWLATRKLAGQLGAVDQVMTRSDVLVWAVKETVIEHAEAVKDAGQAALNAASSAVGAIPTIAKAFAAGAIGLGVYAIAKRG